MLFGAITHNLHNLSADYGTSVQNMYTKNQCERFTLQMSVPKL